jgi:hypothetical protein
MPFQQLLMRGSRGEPVGRLKRAVAAELGPEAALFPGLANDDDAMDADTEAALRRWQSGTGLVADGIAGPHCFTLLGLRAPVPLAIKPDLPAVRLMFPQTKPSNIVRYLPYVTDALEALGLTDRAMVLAALGTIRAETAGFVPIAEYPSRLNTLPGQGAFSAYEPGTRIGQALGNARPGDGARYRGRGFVQLTGADNYERYTLASGIDLVGQPDLANAPEVAAVLLAMFLADRAPAMRSAIARGNYAAARKLVNGGSHGLDAFRSVFAVAKGMWSEGRAGARVHAARPAVVRERDTKKDPPDIRDRLFQPAPVLLPDVFPAEADLRAHFRHYRQLVLDQGNDFSCTGYALATVINFARWRKSGWQAGLPSVSPRMLYNYARRYDEYAGEDYDGSSCRGALKGWFHHGVCLEPDWPDHQRPRFGYAERALQTTLGVYYRIDIRSITDMQAAVLQSNAIYVSAFTHEGWELLDGERASRAVPTHESLPEIDFDGRPSRSNGHAFAIVGFNRRGFIVQNSWGPGFGVGGFAILTYADWLANAMDAWVASLGVPGVVQGRLSEGGFTSAKASARRGAWWDEGTAYRHSVVIGNDGRVARYLSQDELPRTLHYQACALPDRWFRAQPGLRKRLVIYAHGGLNSEREAIARARVLGRYFTGNGCYPLFLVWRTGLLESLGHMLEDAARAEPQLAGALSDRLFDITDQIIERTLGRGPARMVWNEMKENARFACHVGRAGDHLAAALQMLASTWGEQLEVHLVGHSAGAILLGRLLNLLASREVTPRVAGTHLFAPACTVQFANRHFAPHEAVMRNLWLHVLDDALERDDNVAGIYRKSLLYLVSNALEPDLRTPLVGMHKVLDAQYGGWDGSSTTGEALGRWREAAHAVQLDSRTRVVRDARVPIATGQSGPAHHGSFDNNIDVMGFTLARITGAPLPFPVKDLRGF